MKPKIYVAIFLVEAMPKPNVSEKMRAPFIRLNRWLTAKTKDDH